MQTKKLLVSTLILATLGGTFLQVSPVFAVNRSTYSQGSTNDKKYGMGAYAAYWNNYGNHWAQVSFADKWGGTSVGVHANQQAYAWLNTYWGQRVNFFHGNGYMPDKHWGK
ncbi:lactococcin 972 family bacteriocin [Lactococcus lactis]|uniref:Lactococcin 972 family bacteriocin n=1 Tax=Lactococcus lactis TaxID=1358 RepID=A0AAP8E024_9LACT|nr:lactococcin 972 family bacteriocin [Lactococcus lactis]MDG4972155.1 lactococcin 972 family bacteriocin [Lactococcus lactis]PFG88195.1 lactococcin 972 family bacteriocin [Lactococcus lactis]